MFASPIQLLRPLEVFDLQVVMLRSKGFIVLSADINRLRLLVPERPQRFLFMPSCCDMRNLDGLMSRIPINGKIGVNHLKLEHACAVIETPIEPYLLLGVDDGHDRPFVSDSSYKDVLIEGRKPFTIFMGTVYMMLFPHSKQNLALSGSRYQDNGIPRLLVPRHGGEAELCCYPNDEFPPDWGIPSFESIAT